MYFLLGGGGGGYKRPETDSVCGRNEPNESNILHVIFVARFTLGGAFFLACVDFGKMFDHSPPALFFFFF